MWSLGLLNAVGRVVPPRRSLGWGPNMFPGVVKSHKDSAKEEEEALIRALANLAPGERLAAYQMILREYFSIKRENSDLATNVSNLQAHVKYYEGIEHSLNRDLEELSTQLKEQKEDLLNLQKRKQTNDNLLVILLIAAGLTLTYQLLPEKKESLS